MLAVVLGEGVGSGKRLAALEPADALPCAIAVYATARRAEIRYARVEDVDLELGVIYLGVDERGRKSRAAQRAVPLVKPLASLLRRELMRRGRPDGGSLLCPGGERITAHECRHTCASWLDAAGLRPVVVSAVMGHSSPARQAGAPAITQQRYTHTLPGELEQAKARFGRWLEADATAAEARSEEKV